ncbi:MAG: ABC transporter permease [Dermatophilaceae bacterium]
MSSPTSSTISGGTDPDVIVHAVVAVPISKRRRLVAGGALILVGLVCVLLLGLGSRSGYDASFQLAPADASVKVPNLTLPARLTAILLGLVVIALGVLQIARGFSRRAMTWVLAATGFCFMVAFLCWSATGGDKGGTLDLLGLLQQSIFLAIPLILGALAGVLCERSGVINVAIEGQMLSGAWAGALVATLVNNKGLGIVAAVVAGGLMGLLLAVFAIRYFVNQVVLGVVLNVLALGLTGFIYDALMQPNQDTLNNPGFFDPVKIPVLGDVPILGPLLFNTNVIVYLTYLLIIVVDVALFRTRWGLRARAVGEHPKAADTVGINVLRTRYRNVVYGGMVAGLAGAFLTIGAVGAFSKNISSGKGFIALAAVIFGRWSPRGAIAAALLFGFANALQTVLSFTQTPVTIPSSFLAMLPYLATLFAVAGLVGRVRAPAADGEPYVKG